MLGTLFVVLGSFAWMIVRAYRRGASEPFQPEGKVRWTEEPHP